MHKQCRMSCGLCTNGGLEVATECVDLEKSRQCREWAWHGEWYVYEICCRRSYLRSSSHHHAITLLVVCCLFSLVMKIPNTCTITAVEVVDSAHQAH
jgi:hypothetical protein